jgi:hypothetical protein
MNYTFYYLFHTGRSASRQDKDYISWNTLHHHITTTIRSAIKHTVLDPRYNFEELYPFRNNYNFFIQDTVSYQRDLFCIYCQHTPFSNGGKWIILGFKRQEIFEYSFPCNTNLIRWQYSQDKCCGKYSTAQAGVKAYISLKKRRKKAWQWNYMITMLSTSEPGVRFSWNFVWYHKLRSHPNF